ncbi:MAG: DUF697 domain-containing protein [Gaiellaceae bacterium]
MRIPISLGAVYGVVKELSKTRDRPLLVAGKVASGLARELISGGDASAVRTGGSPEDVEALMYIVGDEVTADDERVLKLAHRARVPTIVVAAGRSAPERIPFVLATDVVRAQPGRGFPVEEIARALAAKLGEDATSLARRLPVLRDAVCKQLIESFARKNALIAAAVFIPGVDLPVLTLNQIRLVLRICAAHGLPVDNSRAPEILATLGAGLGFRTVARELLDFVPGAGWALKGTVAYLGTKAIGEAAVRYCETRTTSPA